MAKNGWRLGACLVLGAVLATGGCMKRPVPVRPTWAAHAYPDAPLSPSAAVFGLSDAGSADGRSDARLAHSPGGLGRVLNAWPEAARPSLRDARRQSYSSASQFVYVPGASARGAPRRPLRTTVVVPPPNRWIERPPVYHPSRPPYYDRPHPPYQPHQHSHPGSVWR